MIILNKYTAIKIKPQTSMCATHQLYFMILHTHISNT